MIYLDKFLHFISADGHHYKVPSSISPLIRPSQPILTVGGRPFATYDQSQNLVVSRPLPLAYSVYDPSPFPSPPGNRVYNLSNVGRKWSGSISISGDLGSVSVESETDSTFDLEEQGMTSIDYPYFGYKVYIEFYDRYFQLVTTSDWIEWAYRDGDRLTHQLREVYVTLSDSTRYVKIRYNCFQSSDVTDSGPHVDYTSDYIDAFISIDTFTSININTNNIYFTFSEQIS